MYYGDTASPPEQALRQSLMMSHGGVSISFDRPIAAVLMSRSPGATAWARR
jgi:TctA family transporter